MHNIVMVGSFTVHKHSALLPGGGEDFSILVILALAMRVNLANKI